MGEKIAVYSLTPQGGARRGRQWRLAHFGPAAAALAVLVILAVGTSLWLRAWPRDMSVAVAAFQAGGADDASRALAASLAGDVAAALTNRQVATVSQEAAGLPRRGGARLLVRGAVDRSQSSLRVRVSLTDLAANRTVWATTIERPGAQADALGEQTAVKVADTVDRALHALDRASGQNDPELLTDLLKMFDQQRDNSAGLDRNIALDRRIIARAPNFALGHAALAMDLASSLNGQPAAVVAQMRAEAAAEVTRALALDPSVGDAHLARQRLLPRDHFAEREAELSKGLQADAQHAALNNFMGDLLRDVGRLQDAGAFYQRALQLDPLSPPKTTGSIAALAGAGQEAQAEALIDRGLRLFPTRGILRTAIYNSVLYAPPDRALAILDQASGEKSGMNDAEVRLWRAYVNGPRRGHADPKLLRALAEAARADRIDLGAAISALAQAGDVDAAFTETRQAMARQKRNALPTFYGGATRSMRRDPRFMPLAADLGLVAYWRATNHWPDFCADADLPYDCKAAALAL
ncbi:MAG: hypothetical protein JWQ29_2084, partial [Phenylobacterium sp.]|nr:hypothetical protein [Phenylobacterium sp.]